MGMPHGERRARPRADFKTLFESLPGLYLVLDPSFTIVAATNQHREATMTTREESLGKCIFDVYPENPDEAEATGLANLKASLERVRRRLEPDTMAVQR